MRRLAARLRATSARLAGLLGSARRKHSRAAERDVEFESHLQLQTDDNLARGMSPAAAARAARLQAGGLAAAAEACRDRATLPGVEAGLRDLHFALRQLRRALGFSLTAVVTLGVGLAACAVVFSLVNTILLRPPPYPAPGRVVFPWRLVPAGAHLSFDELPWDDNEFRAIAQVSTTWQSLGAFRSGSYNLTGVGKPQRLDGIRASAGFFPTLGVAPQLGRWFTSAEDQPGAEREVILSAALWRQRFHADPAIIGRSIALSGALYDVVGVMPASFVFPEANQMPANFDFPRQPQLWVPLALPPVMPRFADAELAVVGRLRPGVSLQQARAAMNLFSQREDQRYPSFKGWWHSRLAPLPQQAAGASGRPLLLLFAAVGIVLLIVCANLAGLLLTRALERGPEFTLRAALGASRAMLIRQVLAESLLVALAGGGLALGLADAGIALLRRFGPADIPRLTGLTLDGRVLAFTLGLALLTALAIGLLPALTATRAQLMTTLKTSGRGSIPRLGRLFLVAEIALALVLAIAASLLVESLAHTLRADPGFDATHAVSFELSLPSSRYPDSAHSIEFYQAMLRRLQALPGVEAAALTETTPLDGAPESTAIRLPGRPPARPGQFPFTNYTVVSSQYFAAVGTPVLRGRGLLDSDTPSTRSVAVINAAMAASFWPHANPIGQQIVIPALRQPMTIVGIVANAKHLSLREAPQPEMYVPFTQPEWTPLDIMQVVARAQGDPAAVKARLRQALNSVDPDLPLADFQTLTSLVAASVAAQGFAVLVLGAFGGLGLGLAALGVYGLMARAVVRRTPEIGIRMALGAPPRQVRRMLLVEAARLAAWGIAAGLVAAWALSRALTGFLYGVQPADPATFAAMALLLLGVALGASLLPARRAAQLDPLRALRHQR